MAEPQFRVTVEDLVERTRRVMEFYPGDYVLIPFEPCHRGGVSASVGGTHVITIKDHGPLGPAREVPGDG